MKHKIKIYSILAAASLFFTVGCSDFLEEDTSGQVFANVLETADGLESALTGAYRGWACCWSYGFVNGWATEMTLGGDDMTCPPGTGGNTQQFDRYDVLNTNSSTSPVYSGAYKAIQGANSIIENYETCEGDEATITAIAGEAYFIRAWSYYWLVRCHGELPLMLTAVYSTEDVNMELSSVKEIYTQIESDLTNAISMLSDTRRNGEMGRPNKGTALAVLAEVYLTEAGWPLKETDKYALAASTAKQVLDNRASYGFDFESSYDVLWENNDELNDCINSEDIFVIPTDENNGNALNALNGYWCYPGELSGWDVVFSELKFYNDFPEGPRKDATFATTVTTQTGEELVWTELKYARPYFKKLMKNEAHSSYYSYSSSIPIRMLRFSRTALTYAEASARATGSVDDLAYECINAIRERSELSTYSGMSASDFADACVQERAWELAAERVRWFDLVRLETLAEVVAARDASDNQAINAITEAVYTFPIPYTDELLNSNINN